jgi:hypothetical protein
MVDPMAGRLGSRISSSCTIGAELWALKYGLIRSCYPAIGASTQFMNEARGRPFILDPRTPSCGRGGARGVHVSTGGRATARAVGAQRNTVTLSGEPRSDRHRSGFEQVRLRALWCAVS